MTKESERKYRKNVFIVKKLFFFLFRLESNCFAATAKENMLHEMYSW